MKESKHINVKHNRYQLYTTRIARDRTRRYECICRDAGVQYDCPRDLICTCRISRLRRAQEVRYLSNQPRHIYYGSRSYIDIGVGSIKALQKRKVRRIYLPETDETGVGSSDLSALFIRKNKPYRGSCCCETKNTSAKTVEKFDNAMTVLHEKLSPITNTTLGNTSTKLPILQNQKKNVDFGSNTEDKISVSISTQINEPIINEEMKIEVRTVEVRVEHDKPEKQKRKPSLKMTARGEEGEKQISKRAQEAERVYSSDSLVQHVHNLEDPSEDKHSHADVNENKLEREYRKMFTTKSKESKEQKTDEERISMKSTSLLRRRFEALRRGLAKKDDSKRNAVVADKESSNVSQPVKRDVSIASDPPSLESRSYSDIKINNPPNTEQNVASHSKAGCGKPPALKKTSNRLPEEDSSYQGAEGMFKLWGKKFNLEVDESPDSSQVKDSTESNKKDGKRFFFFKKRSSNKEPKQLFKEGVTTGRCEVGNGLMIKIGAAHAKSPPPKKKEVIAIDRIPTIDQIPEEYEELYRKAWLQKFLAKTIESRNSVKIRWNNKHYATSSSTVYEIMENVYKDTGIIFRSKSEIAAGGDKSSYYKSCAKQRVNFVQDIQAWMIPNIIPSRMNNKEKEVDKDKIQVRISDQKWIIDKSKAFSHKIEVVLHSRNIVNTRKNASADYLMIDIPKGFFSDSGTTDSGEQEPTSNEEVYKIVEYELPEYNTHQNTANFEIGDHLKDIKVTVSLKDSRNFESKIIETVIKSSPTQRDIATQGSRVHIPKKCNVIGVGIITQQDVHRVRKPILKIRDEYSDDESDHSVHARHVKSKFAESYLQDYYRHWTPLGIELSWCISDSKIQCCSEDSEEVVNNQGDGTKSCPNIFDNYVTSTVISSCGTSCCSPCGPIPLCDPYEDSGPDKPGIVSKFYNKIKLLKPPDGYEERRTFPKDSIEVFKRRKIYAMSDKAKWRCPDEDEPCPVPRKESKCASIKDSKCSIITESNCKPDTMIECPKILKSCWKPTPAPPKKKICNKHVSLPDCDTLNTSLLKTYENVTQSGILTFKGAAKCEVCEKGSRCAKHGVSMDCESPCVIPPPNRPCMDEPPGCGEILPARDLSKCSQRSMSCEAPPKCPSGHRMSDSCDPPSPCPHRSPACPHHPPPACPKPPPACPKPPPACPKPPPPACPYHSQPTCPYPPQPTCHHPPQPACPHHSPPTCPHSPKPACPQPPPPACPSPPKPACPNPPPACPSPPRPAYPNQPYPPKVHSPLVLSFTNCSVPRPCLPPHPPPCPHQPPCHLPPPPCGHRPPPQPCGHPPPQPCHHPPPQPCHPPPESCFPPPSPCHPPPQPCHYPPPSPCHPPPQPFHHPPPPNCYDPPPKNCYDPPDPACPKPRPCPPPSEPCDPPPQPCETPPEPCESPPEPCESPPKPCHPKPCDPKPCPPKPCEKPPKLCKKAPPPREPCNSPPEPCESPPKPCNPKPCPPKKCPHTGSPIPCSRPKPKPCKDPPKPCSHPKPEPCDDPPEPCDPPPKPCSKPKPCGEPKPCGKMEKSDKCKSPGRQKRCAHQISGIHLYSPPRSACTSPLRTPNCDKQKEPCDKPPPPCGSSHSSSASSNSQFSLRIKPSSCSDVPKSCSPPRKPPKCPQTTECKVKDGPKEKFKRFLDLPVKPECKPTKPKPCPPDKPMKFPWPLKNQNSNQCSIQSMSLTASMDFSAQTCTYDNELQYMRKQVQCPSKTSCRTPPRVSGIFLKMRPGCPVSCNQQGDTHTFARRMKDDDIVINIKKATDSTAEIREGLNIKVQDFDGNTLFERRDFTNNDREVATEQRRHSVLNEMYKNSNVHVVSTTKLVRNMECDEESNVELEDAKSEASVANLIEINFKLKVTHGNKTTEFQLGTDEGVEMDKLKSKSQTDQTCPEVFMLKDEAEQCTDETNDKNDVNIKIIIKNYKPKNKSKPICDEFAQSISKKFQTVSTGYSNVGSNEDNVYSVHRTVDLDTTEGSETNTQTKETDNEISYEQDRIDTIPQSNSAPEIQFESNSDMKNTENIFKSRDNEVKDIQNYVYTEERPCGEKLQSYSSATDTTDEQGVVKETIKTKTTTSDVAPKSLTRDEKKSILKKVLEKVRKTNTKEKMKQYTDVLNLILTDSSHNEGSSKEKNDLVKEMTCASLKPDYSKDTDSMNNYFHVDSSASSRQASDANPNVKYPTQNQSESSMRDTDESCDDDDDESPGTCLCSTFAARLKICSIGGGGCCCRGPTKVDEETCCDLRTDEDFLLMNYKTIEYIDVETQNSKYYCNNKISVQSRAASGSFRDNAIKDDKVSEIFKKEFKKKDTKDFATTVHHKTPCQYKKINRNTMLGISDDDKIVVLNTKPTNVAVATKFTRDTKKDDLENEKQCKKAAAKYEAVDDMLQSYETKKAVLEIYAEKTVSDESHLVARLPKFVYEKESDIERNYGKYVESMYESVKNSNVY